MRFGYVGVRYQEAPLAVREQVSFTDSRKIEVLQKMQGIGVEQCMVLFTCNRSEIFFFCPEELEMELVAACYQNAFPAVDLGAYLQRKEGREAMEYLFRIAAGLESLVLGEDQILGQTGDAVDFARTMGFAGKELNKVVRDAVTCAKEIKTRFRISEKPLSVSYIGVQKLKKICPLKGKRILLIGSGKMASLALHYLIECEPEEIIVCSRNRKHAEELKHLYEKICVCEYRERYRCMERCHAVISATASPHLVVGKKEVEAVLQRRMTGYRIEDAGIAFLDLATPRDMEEGIGQLPGTQIINMDTLQKICEENWKKREELAGQSRAVIGQSVAATEEWLRVSRMDDTIESLQKRCGDIVEDSFSYLNRKLALENREKKILKKVLNASLQRLLKEPIQELKKLDSTKEQDEYKKMMEHLFRIGR